VRNNYPEGILDTRSNKVFSATIASLIHLGAYDVLLLKEDILALQEEVSKHFSEDRNEKLKIL